MIIEHWANLLYYTLNLQSFSLLLRHIASSSFMILLGFHIDEYRFFKCNFQLIVNFGVFPLQNI